MWLAHKRNGIRNANARKGGKGADRPTQATERASDGRPTRLLGEWREKKEGRTEKEEEKAAKIPLLPLFPIRNQSAIARPPPLPSSEPKLRPVAKFNFITALGTQL